MNQEQLNEVIHKHKLWLEGKEKGVRAVMIGEDLRYADLVGEDLRGSDLSFTDLRYSKLSRSDLGNCNLKFSNLSRSNLRFSNLSKSDLRFSRLSGSDMSEADLTDAALSHADLSQVKGGLIWADCSFTDHGECGRRLLAVRIAGEVKFFCECFTGNAEELYRFIQSSKRELIPTRMDAFRFVWCKMAAQGAKA